MPRKPESQRLYNALRKDRYWTDPEYRIQEKLRSKAYRQNARLQERASKLCRGEPVYSLSKFSSMFGLTENQVRKMGRLGVIPLEARRAGNVMICSAAQINLMHFGACLYFRRPDFRVGFAFDLDGLKNFLHTFWGWRLSDVLEILPKEYIERASIVKRSGMLLILSLYHSKKRTIHSPETHPLMTDEYIKAMEQCKEILENKFREVSPYLVA